MLILAITGAGVEKSAMPTEPIAEQVLNRNVTYSTPVLERYYNYDIIEAMQDPNKSKKDPVTEWAVGQPLVMQTEHETLRKTKLGTAATLARVKKTLPARQSAGAPKKSAVSKPRRKNKKTSS